MEQDKAGTAIAKLEVEVFELQAQLEKELLFDMALINGAGRGQPKSGLFVGYVRCLLGTGVIAPSPSPSFCAYASPLPSTCPSPSTCPCAPTCTSTSTFPSTSIPTSPSTSVLCVSQVLPLGLVASKCSYRRPFTWRPKHLSSSVTKFRISPGLRHNNAKVYNLVTHSVSSLV